MTATRIQVGATERDLVADAEAIASLVDSACRRAIQEERRLPREIVGALQELGALRMSVPRQYGGLEIDPVTQVRVVEALAQVDASIAWCSMIGSSTSSASAYVAPEVARDLFSDDDLAIAGSVLPGGKAEIVDGGYRVTGTWRFASGSPHATLFVGGCVIVEGGVARQLPSGSPEVRVMTFLTQDVEILDTWYTTGLAGTGSHDFNVRDAFVPQGRSWVFGGEPNVPGSLYRYPALILTTHAGVPLGIARRAIDEFVAYTESRPPSPALNPPAVSMREDIRVQEAVARAEGALASVRSFVYSTLNDMWATLESGVDLTTRQRAMYRIMLIEVHQVAKQITSSMHEGAGTTAIYRPHALEQLERDILTACQHGMLHPRNYGPAGRALVGLEPSDPVF